MKKLPIGFIRCLNCKIRVKQKNKEKHDLKKCPFKTGRKIKSIRPRFTSETYQSIYLKSEHWIAIRKKYYSIFKKCQLCRTIGKLNIHHLTYKRLGNERNTDLIVLCEDCHINRVHKKLIKHTLLKRIVTLAWEPAVGSIFQPV